MSKFIGQVFGTVFVLVVGVGVGLAMAFPIMWCWNYAVPQIWNLPRITWQQAWCLAVLANALIRSPGAKQAA